MRVALACALFTQPDILLLDEVPSLPPTQHLLRQNPLLSSLAYFPCAWSCPCSRFLCQPTNHLDLHAVLWLTEYLQSLDITCVIVSHDSRFLSDVTVSVKRAITTELCGPGHRSAQR